MVRWSDDGRSILLLFCFVFVFSYSNMIYRSCIISLFLLMLWYCIVRVVSWFQLVLDLFGSFFAIPLLAISYFNVLITLESVGSVRYHTIAKWCQNRNESHCLDNEMRLEQTSIRYHIHSTATTTTATASYCFQKVGNSHLAPVQICT